LEFPRVERECFDEGWQLILNFPTYAESWFFGNLAQQARETRLESNLKSMYVGHPGGHLSKDLVDHEGSMGHGGGAGKSLRRLAL